MARLVDTNVLVYRYDPRFPKKQRIATDLLRRGLADDTLRLPHQAILEFVAAVSRLQKDGSSLLAPVDARREAEDFQHDRLYGTVRVVNPFL